MAPASRFLAALLASFSAGLGLLAAVTTAAGEFHLTSRAVAIQIAQGGIYGRVIWDDFFAYKLALYEAAPTAVVSIGSSRAMPVRAGLFRDASHVSLGGAVQSIEQMESLAAELARLPTRPATALVFVDFEWFISNPPRATSIARREPYESRIFVLQSAFAHLGELTRAMVASPAPPAAATDGPLIGARARIWGDGFRRDGSIRHFSYENGLRPFVEPDMAEILVAGAETAALDVERFIDRRGWRNATIREGLAKRFEAALLGLNAAGIRTILVLPPVVPHVATALRDRSDLAFYRDWLLGLTAIAARLGSPLFDFTEVPLRHPDCWMDRYHATEGAYAWILGRIHIEYELKRPASDRFLDADAILSRSRDACMRVLDF